MSNKIEYVNEIIRLFTVHPMSQVLDVADERQKEYFDQGYNAGGSNPITDGDIAGMLLTAADIEAAITFLQQIDNFANNTAVATADYMATMNKIRRGRITPT